MERYKLKISKSHKNTGRIRKAITSGFFFHAAKKDSEGGYKTLIDNH